MSSYDVIINNKNKRYSSL